MSWWHHIRRFFSRNPQDPAQTEGRRYDHVRIIKIDGGLVAGHDTVRSVKEKVRSLLSEKASQDQSPAPADAIISVSDHITLFLDRRPMRDDSLFYADNFIMLPVWVQVFVHEGDCEGFMRLLCNLRDKMNSQRAG